MGELVGIVEVEVVDDVGVGEGMEGEQVNDVRVVGSGGDEGVAGGGFADGGGLAGLDAGPAVGVVDLRLVHDLEEDFVGVAVSEVGGEAAPEHGEAVNGVVAGEEALLVAFFRVEIDLDGEAVGEHGVNGFVEAGEELGVEAVSGARVLLEGDGIDAEADVVKAEAGDEGDVLSVGIAVGARGGVVGGGLGEPLRGVDAAAEMLGAGEGDLDTGGVLGGGGEGEGEQGGEKQGADGHAVAPQRRRLGPMKR